MTSNYSRFFSCIFDQTDKDLLSPVSVRHHFVDLCSMISQIENGSINLCIFVIIMTISRQRRQIQMIWCVLKMYLAYSTLCNLLYRIRFFISFVVEKKFSGMMHLVC